MSQALELQFREPQQARARMQALNLAGNGSCGITFETALAKTADPDLVLVRLEAFLDVSTRANEEKAWIAAEPAYARLLCTIFDQSAFLTHILTVRPEYARWLATEARLDKSRPRSAMILELRARGADMPAFEDVAREMRQFKQREILRIGVRELDKHAPVRSLTRDLSNLADACLQLACEAASTRLRARFGLPRHFTADGARADSRFAIVALGKLGGRELNFSSDIDLLFIYSDEGDTEGGERSISNSEYYQKLGEQIIKAMADPTVDGIIFRVDMRLRPHGRMAPLATNFESTVEYYERYGRAWERQALIKARAAAGDSALGAQFIERVRQYVFPRYFDDETLEDIRETKLQMEAQIASLGHTEIEVKLGHGGIRDIEYTVQMLQLLNGGRLTGLRTPSTLTAIEALGRYNLLSPFEATTLASNYAFLRKVEHRLQIEGSQQRHVLPAEPEALDAFARRIGYQNGASFMSAYRDRARETRQILERFFATQGAGNLWVSDLLNPFSEGEAGLQQLEQMGFAQPSKARDELLLLCNGPAEHPHSAHIRQRFKEVAPALLEALARRADPDATLLRLSQIIMNLRAPAAVYDILRTNPNLAEHLSLLVENSQYLSELLIRDPGLFEEFSARESMVRGHTRQQLEEELEHLQRAHDPEAAPYRLRDSELMRISMRDLFGHITVLQVGDELTQLAEVCLVHALEEAQKRVIERFGPTHTAFAVLGMGKFSGFEMGYGSDLDLVFLYDAEGAVPSGVSLSEYFGAVAAHTIRILSQPTRYGVLYEVDARLRPDGKRGMLTVSSRRAAEYYLEEAQPWERLALIKVRAVAGGMAFGKTMQTLAQELAFSLPLTHQTRERLESTRQKMVASASPWDLKKAEGGRNEIEFAVRLLQLKLAPEHPELKRGDAIGALDIMTQRSLITADVFGALFKPFLLFRKLENRMRMMHGRSGSELPADEPKRQDLARRLGIRGDLWELVQDHRREAHAIYLRVLDEVFRH
jgi:[glutamine synthetase] adenylyltransferase / [glutamine synthetase]-adenylyl-L-tyrosine phosphorylase